MNFIDQVLKLYKSLSTTDFNKFNLSINDPFSLFIGAISQNIQPQSIFNQYRKEVDAIIEKKLNIFSSEIQVTRKLKKISFYEKTLAVNTCIIIFWMLYNKSELSKSKLSDMVEAFYLGSVGYRLFDVHYDDDQLGKESAILGNYMLHLGEELLMEVFGYKDTFKILNKYLAQYTEAEYLEKRNRWKSCPFSWEDPKKIGYKAAPIFSIFEIIFRTANYNDEKINHLIDAITKISAVFQITDDIADMHEDLNSGIETLVLSGFYRKYGTPSLIDDNMISSILTEKRTMLIYNTIQNLSEETRMILTKYEDDILLLYLELCSYSINRMMLAKGYDEVGINV
jgi:hypothetical protein